MKTARPRIDVNLDELDRVLDGARQAPLKPPTGNGSKTDDFGQESSQGVKAW
jgi:hypothetical protein